tara:strand:- start:136 stop:363 length:228 start_codon:yes stop_codon:yes gene_type:complete
MEGYKMIGLGKTVKNYIENYIKQQIGINPHSAEIRKLKNEVRSLRGNMARTNKIVDSLKDLLNCKCNPRLEEKDA